MRRNFTLRRVADPSGVMGFQSPLPSRHDPHVARIGRDKLPVREGNDGPLSYAGLGHGFHERVEFSGSRFGDYIETRLSNSRSDPEMAV